MKYFLILNQIYVYTNKISFNQKINIEQKDINKYFLICINIYYFFIFNHFIIFHLILNFEDAFKLGILTLMNTVNSSMYDLSNFDFIELNSYSK